jgi:hypothetical protein
MEKFDTPNAHIHNRSLSQVGKGTSIKSEDVKLFLAAKIRSLKSMERQYTGQKKNHPKKRQAMIYNSIHNLKI